VGIVGREDEVVVAEQSTYCDRRLVGLDARKQLLRKYSDGFLVSSGTS
jgi:hypothetical protein